MSSDVTQVRDAAPRYRPGVDAQDVPPGYKRTEVGVIPEEWNVRTLAALVQSHNSGIYKRQALYGDGCNIVGVSDIYDIDKVDGQSFASVPLSKEERAKHTLRANDLLYGESSLVPEGIARTIYVTEGGVGTAFAWHTRRYSVVQQVVRAPYLYYYLQSRWARSHMVSQSIQTAITGINTVAYFACPIAVPPPHEQRAIAEALSDVDGLLGTLEAMIAKKRAIKQAAMQQLLTGKTRLPGFGAADANDSEFETPSDWRSVPLSAISSMHGRIGWQGLKQAEFTTKASDPFLITGVDFRDAGIDWDSAYHVSRDRYNIAPQIQLRPADVLVTKDGTIGKLLYVESIPYPGMATLNSHLLVLRPVNDAYVPRFLFYQLSSRRFAEHIEQHKSGSTFFGLSQAATGRFVVLLPAIEEQDAIAAILSDMDAEIAALESHRAKNRAIKQAMMQQLLTGRVRLVKPEAAA